MNSSTGLSPQSYHEIITSVQIRPNRRDVSILIGECILDIGCGVLAFNDHLGEALLIKAGYNAIIAARQTFPELQSHNL